MKELKKNVTKVEKKRKKNHAPSSSLSLSARYTSFFAFVLFHSSTPTPSRSLSFLHFVCLAPAFSQPFATAARAMGERKGEGKRRRTTSLVVETGDSEAGSPGNAPSASPPLSSLLAHSLPSSAAPVSRSHLHAVAEAAVDSTAGCAAPHPAHTLLVGEAAAVATSTATHPLPPTTAATLCHHSSPLSCT